MWCVSVVAIIHRKERQDLEISADFEDDYGICLVKYDKNSDNYVSGGIAVSSFAENIQ
jgi:hypothetical protein